MKKILLSIALLAGCSKISNDVNLLPTNSSFHILRSTTDERGLTSITYVAEGDTFALDYLTRQQLDSLVNPVKPVYVPYFTQCQILPPDYVNPEWTIVIDAIGLNKAIAPIEQGLCPDFGSDLDYYDLFSEFTTSINVADSNYYKQLYAK